MMFNKKNIVWKSQKENVFVCYNKCGFGARYNIYKKTVSNYHEFIISFTFIYEAIAYAKKMYDAPLENNFDNDEYSLGF